MKKFLYKALFKYKEVYNEEFDTSIEHKTYNKILTFDYNLLKYLQEIITQLINNDNEVFQNDNKTVILKEFEQLVPLIPNHNVKTTYCVIVDNNNNDNTIQTCTELEKRYLRQLSSA
ncbi:hypothetical protein C2G38_2158182 [Gigaspora rosea]|uniref:Uncharacterized protein n=1 Tax=Gigaspora rosea TaxID=44941 RepID=A0A397W0P4_9GLOM|nr:hypothetical protein C2G38_2158182 [Gigaspora rosea]